MAAERAQRAAEVLQRGRGDEAAEGAAVLGGIGSGKSLQRGRGDEAAEGPRHCSGIVG